MVKIPDDVLTIAHELVTGRVGGMRSVTNLLHQRKNQLRTRKNVEQFYYNQKKIVRPVDEAEEEL